MNIFLLVCALFTLVVVADILWAYYGWVRLPPLQSHFVRGWLAAVGLALPDGHCGGRERPRGHPIRHDRGRSDGPIASGGTTTDAMAGAAARRDRYEHPLLTHQLCNDLGRLVRIRVFTSLWDDQLPRCHSGLGDQRSVRDPHADMHGGFDKTSAPGSTIGDLRGVHSGRACRPRARSNQFRAYFRTGMAVEPIGGPLVLTAANSIVKMITFRQ